MHGLIKKNRVGFFVAATGLENCLFLYVFLNSY